MGSRAVALIFGALLLSVVGCAPSHGYLEPSDPPSAVVESAIIRTATPLLKDGRDSIVIKTIDGKAPTFLEFKWVVEPGTHELEIQVELKHDSRFSKDKTFHTRVIRKLPVTVEADREYLVDAEENDTGLFIWVRDIETKTVVAGEAPPRPLLGQ